MVVNKGLEQKIQTQLQLQAAEVLGYVKAHPEGVSDKQLVAEFTQRGWVASVIHGYLDELLAAKRLIRTRWRIMAPIEEELLTIFVDKKPHTLEELYSFFPKYHFEVVRLTAQRLVADRRLTMDKRGRLKLRSVM